MSAPAHANITALSILSVPLTVAVSNPNSFFGTDDAACAVVVCTGATVVCPGCVVFCSDVVSVSPEPVGISPLEVGLPFLITYSDVPFDDVIVINV